MPVANTWQADVRPAPVRGVAPDKRTQTEALVRSLKECFEEYLSYSPQISKDVVYNIVSSDNPLYLSEYMPANLLLKYEDKQTILQENSIPSRLEKLLLVMRQECEVLAIEKELDDKVNVQMDKNQRDYYLREQMHIISEELAMPRIPVPKRKSMPRRFRTCTWMPPARKSC